MLDEQITIKDLLKGKKWKNLPNLTQKDATPIKK